MEGQAVPKDGAQGRGLAMASATSDDEKYPVRFLEVFSNELILDNIIVYLDSTSLKLMTETCNLLKSTMRNNRLFVDRFKFNLTTKENAFVPHSLDFPWKHVALDVDEWGENPINTALLSQVEVLEVYSSIEIDYTVPSSRSENLIKLISAPTQLKELLVGFEIFTLEEPGFLAALETEDSPLQKNMKNLQSFRIKGGRDDPYYLSRSYGKHWNVVKALSSLKKILNNLKRFGFEDVIGEDLDEISPNLVSIVNENAATLNTLKLDGKVWNPICKSPDVLKIVLPVLKELEINTSGEYLPVVAEFIARQPPLESLDIHFSGLTTTGRPLFDSLIPKSSQLKKFSLVWGLGIHPHGDGFIAQAMLNNFFVAAQAAAAQAQAGLHQEEPADSDDEDAPGGDEGGAGGMNNGHGILHPGDPGVGFVGMFGVGDILPPSADYSCLHDFSQLKEVKIHQVMLEDAGHGRSSLGTLLSSLPDGVEKIDFGGALSLTSGLATQASYVLFHNLTVLNLIQCPNALNDESLHYICSNFRQMLKLGFSHCEQLTDFGLTGSKDGEIVGPGIQAFTGLKELNISACPRLTQEGFLTAIRYSDLKKLTLRIQQREVSAEFYAQIGAQNKCLETLEIMEETKPESTFDDEGNLVLVPEALLDQLKSVCRSFKNLVYVSELQAVIMDEVSWMDGDEEEDDGSVSGFDPFDFGLDNDDYEDVDDDYDYDGYYDDEDY